jgi:hypothetical protein
MKSGDEIKAASTWETWTVAAVREAGYLRSGSWLAQGIAEYRVGSFLRVSLYCVT